VEVRPVSWTTALLVGLVILVNVLIGWAAWNLSEPKSVKQPGKHSLEMRDGETTKLADAPRQVQEPERAGYPRLRIPPYMR
jgi:beta-lactam-binding protein with PASTA domain